MTGPSMVRSRAWRRACLALASACVFLQGARARADIVECPPAQSGFTVFLSEPAFSATAFPTKEAMRAFMARLHFHLDQQRDGRWVNSPSTDVRFVLCRNRAPEADGQDFDERLVESLFTHRVLLEIWGQLEMDPQEGGPAQPAAQINYLLVPLRYEEFSEETNSLGLQRLRYPDQGEKASADFVQLIARPLDIDAFVAAALGVRLFREKSWDLAHRNLCRANVLLQQMEKRPLGKHQKKAIADLRAYVLKSASVVIAQAKSPPARFGRVAAPGPQEPVCVGGMIAMHTSTSSRPSLRCLSLVTALGLIAMVAPWPAWAGAQRPCTEPAVYRDAAVNTFVLPYRFDGPSPSLELQRASRQISALVHLELLFSILKFGAVGGTDLVSVPGSPCDVDEVIWSVSKRAGPGSLRVGQTLVVVWGRIFEQGDQLYLQTFVRFFRQGADGPLQESIKVQLTGSDTSLELNARLPSQATSFPPRRISKGDLRDLDKRFRSAMVVRKEKSLDSPGQSIDFDPSRVFPYYVTQSSGDWIYIKPMMGGPEGWVLARFGEDGSDSLSLDPVDAGAFLPGSRCRVHAPSCAREFGLPWHTRPGDEVDLGRRRGIRQV